MRKMTHAERGRLGGFAAAQRMTPEERRERSRKGAEALMARDPSHMARLNLRSHGVSVQLMKKADVRASANSEA